MKEKETQEVQRKNKAMKAKKEERKVIRER